MNPDRHSPPGGFTLIEVLVALAIVAFGLIAVFGQLNQSAMAASRLRDKTFAHWIAMNLLTERRLAGQLPGVGKESDDIDMANARWHFEITFSETGVDGMRRADVAVSFADEPDRPLANASAFLAERAPGLIAGQHGTGWPVVDQQASALDEATATPEPTPVPVVLPDTRK